MRCPNCGSKMIYPSTEHKNFSGGKAVAGMIAFGVIGGAAGFIGKDTKGYRCSACGAFCQETLSYSTETAINSAVNAAKHNNDFSQYNIFKETYQNLEQIISSEENTLIKNNSKKFQSEDLEEATTLIKHTYKPNIYACDCPIFVEAIILKTRDEKDFLSFIARNKSSNAIRSVYFDVKVLDDAGDTITETTCVFQGLSVSSGENLPIDKEFPLNTDLAFKVDFKCVKATFVDDSVWRDEGNQTYTISEQDAILEENFSKYKALKLKFAENKASDDAVIYQPIVTENYVQCVCGYPFNPEERCFNCGRNVEDIGELISFELLEEYEKEIIKQKAETRYKECKEFKNNVLEKNYSYALTLKDKQSISSIEEAISILTKIEDYKDSKEQIKLCNERKAQIIDKNEKLIEAERIAEEERIAKEKDKKKKKKKIAIVLSSFIGLIATLVIVFITIIIPGGRYNDAINLMKDSKYEEAIFIFESLGTYKDSVNKINECNTGLLDIKYDNAVKLLDEKQFDEAYGIFLELGEHKDSKEKLGDIRLAKTNILKNNITVGSFIVLGEYEQDNDTHNGKEMIEWLVLEVKNRKALVISKCILDCEPYNVNNAKVTWATCSLRKWLNSEFLNTAFSNGEKSVISKVTVSADKNPEFNTNPGESTRDQVFLLSITELNKYISTIKANRGILTEYVEQKGIDKNPYSGSYSWWLRTPGSGQSQASLVASYSCGVVDLFVFDKGSGIRPAMWIDLSKIE